MIFTVSTSPVRLCRYEKARKKIKIQNLDDSSVLYFRKDDPNVSSSAGPHKGKELQPNQNYVNNDPDCIFEVWAVVASGSISVDVEEEY